MTYRNQPGDLQEPAGLLTQMNRHLQADLRGRSMANNFLSISLTLHIIVIEVCVYVRVCGLVDILMVDGFALQAMRV